MQISIAKTPCLTSNTKDHVQKQNPKTDASDSCKEHSAYFCCRPEQEQIPKSQFVHKYMAFRRAGIATRIVSTLFEDLYGSLLMATLNHLNEIQGEHGVDTSIYFGLRNGVRICQAKDHNPPNACFQCQND